MNKYSIDQTTKEQRTRIVSEANAISDLGGTKLSESGKKLLNRYVCGELEIDEVKKIMIGKYTNETNRK